MNRVEIKRETRRQLAFERLGIKNPRCIICGLDNPLVLELHHIAGYGCDDGVVPVCRNCHRLLSDAQKDHSRLPGGPPSDRERMRQFLLGLADLFELLVRRIREFATRLFGPDDPASPENGEARP